MTDNVVGGGGRALWCRRGRDLDGGKKDLRGGGSLEPRFQCPPPPFCFRAQRSGSPKGSGSGSRGEPHMHTSKRGPRRADQFEVRIVGQRVFGNIFRPGRFAAASRAIFNSTDCLRVWALTFESIFQTLPGPLQRTPGQRHSCGAHWRAHNFQPSVRHSLGVPTVFLLNPDLYPPFSTGCKSAGCQNRVLLSRAGGGGGVGTRPRYLGYLGRGGGAWGGGGSGGEG